MKRPKPKPKARARRPRNANPDTAGRILDVLETAHPEAECALRHENPYQLLTATILSAQCTDATVNQVTPGLFARFPDAAALAAARTPTLEGLIRPTGFFRAKAKSLIGCAKGLQKDHGGVVPRTIGELVKLPGVGRKTANVVIGHAYGVNEGIAVDTHVRRVANRLGMVDSEDPAEIEQQLMAIIPSERWTRTTDLLIFHGRKICYALRPACGRCPVFAPCTWEGKQARALATAGEARQ